MDKVKGSLVLEVARMIRANKEREWNKYLGDQDLELINSRVLASSWYPADVYERASYAIFMEIAKGSLEVARAWGKFVVQDIINRYYPNLVQERDVGLALEKFRVIRSQWFQFDDPKVTPIEIMKLGPDKAKIVIRSDHPVPFEPYAHQAAGSFERVVELCGKTDVKATITEHDWKADQPWAIIILAWK
jgi:hypothetical protein